jgi:hypothetical protein
MGGVQAAGVRYRLSFTAGGLFVDAAPVVAAVYLRARGAEPDVTARSDLGDTPAPTRGSGPAPSPASTGPIGSTWSAVRAEIERDNLLQARTAASSTRLAREVVQRLATLTDPEIRILIDATATERGHLLWVAACRHYDLVGDFAHEVVRERFLLMRPTLTHDDFDDFLAAKALWHPELTDLKPSTLKRLRSNVFLMLRQAALMADDGTLNRVVLSHRVADALTTRTPSDVRFFPTLDGERGGV